MQPTEGYSSIEQELEDLRRLKKAYAKELKDAKDFALEKSKVNIKLLTCCKNAMNLITRLCACSDPELAKDKELILNDLSVVIEYTDE